MTEWVIIPRMLGDPQQLKLLLYKDREPDQQFYIGDGAMTSLTIEEAYTLQQALASTLRLNRILSA